MGWVPGMKRAHWLIFLKVGIGVALFAALYRAAGARGMLTALSDAHVSDFWIACALMGVALAFNGLRWQVVMRTIERPISVRAALTATFESMFFQQVVPGGVGGDVSRGVRAYDCGVPPKWAFIGVVIDRGVGLLFVAVTLAAAALTAHSRLIGAPPFRALLLTSAIIMAGAACAVFLGAFRAPQWLPPRLAAAAELLRANFLCIRSPQFLLLASIYLICSTFAYVGSFFFCARALDVIISPWDAAIVVQGMVLVSVLPVSVGGWGLREGAALALLAPLGVDGGRAMAVSVLLGLVLTLLGVFGAFIWFASSYQRLTPFETSESWLKGASRPPLTGTAEIVDTESA
jgi:glycosyltransferase 2 family protein